MIKQTQAIHRQQMMDCLSVVDYFVTLVLKELREVVMLTLFENLMQKFE